MVGQSRFAVEPDLGVQPLPAGTAIDCVALTCFDSNVRFWASLFGSGGIRVHQAQTLDQADFLLTVTAATVLVMDVVFLDGSWDQAVTMLAQCHPLVPSLLIADEVDESFVSGALKRGVLGILWKPIELYKLRRSIRFANEAAVERMLWCQTRGRDAIALVAPLPTSRFGRGRADVRQDPNAQKPTNTS